MLVPQVIPEEASRQLLRKGPQTIIVSLGVDGVLIVEKEKVMKIPAIKIAKVKDTTGAGDALAAGIISGFLGGLSWQQAALQGSAVAAMKIQHTGARTGLPTASEVHKFLQSLERS